MTRCRRNATSPDITFDSSLSHDTPKSNLPRLWGAPSCPTKTGCHDDLGSITPTNQVICRPQLTLDRGQADSLNSAVEGLVQIQVGFAPAEVKNIMDTSQPRNQTREQL